MKIQMFNLDDACNHITLRDDGYISVETAFKKGFKGDYLILITCVEDNANGIIDWPAVETAYRRSCARCGNGTSKGRKMKKSNAEKARAKAAKEEEI